MVDREAFSSALACACGNITHAGVILGVSKVHANRLARSFRLRDEARDMRLAVGGGHTGRPRKKGNVNLDES